MLPKWELKSILQCSTICCIWFCKEILRFEMMQWVLPIFCGNIVQRENPGFQFRNSSKTSTKCNRKWIFGLLLFLIIAFLLIDGLFVLVDQIKRLVNQQHSKKMKNYVHCIWKSDVYFFHVLWFMATINQSIFIL